MQYTWINKDNNDSLILFFNGWACDAEPFQFLQNGDADVLMLFNYTSLEIENELVEKIKAYDNLHLVAWSFGVWVAQYTMEQYHIKVQKALAINGTLMPICENNGIPKAIAQGTLDNLNERNLSKFQRRMCGGSHAWKQFAASLPKRDFVNQLQELKSLYRHFASFPIYNNYFHKAINGESDMIFSVQNQQSYWSDKAEIECIDAPHFCFYNYASWQHLPF